VVVLIIGCSEILVGNLGVIDIFAGDCGRDPRSGKRDLCCCSNCGRDTIS